MRVWYCLAVATIAAAIADLLVESASNAGWFGHGRFTDRSTWDVLPVLAVGSAFIVLQYYRGFRALLVASRSSPSPAQKVIDFEPWIPRLLPTIFAIQLLVLFGMETLEQRVVYGHLIGGSIWLGGPLLVSLSVHAAVCVLVASIAALALRIFAHATLQLVKLVEAFARLHPRAGTAMFANRPGTLHERRLVRILCSLAERAPPSLALSYSSK
jgi:hypothetical protein